MDAKLSQDELAEKVYVTRQTISNWENDKTYPDIKSLVLLSQVFSVTVDQLIHEDVEAMKEVIDEADIKTLDRYSKVYAILMLAVLLSAVPLFFWLDFYALIPFGIIWAVAMAYALKIEKFKKQHDIQTYREIMAFCKGKRLDEIQRQREIGKRPYQKVLLVLGSACVGALFCMLIGFLFHLFLN